MLLYCLLASTVTDKESTLNYVEIALMMFSLLSSLSLVFGIWQFVYDNMVMFISLSLLYLEFVRLLDVLINTSFHFFQLFLCIFFTLISDISGIINSSSQFFKVMFIFLNSFLYLRQDNFNWVLSMFANYFSSISSNLLLNF